MAWVSRRHAKPDVDGYTDFSGERSAAFDAHGCRFQGFRSQLPRHASLETDTLISQEDTTQIQNLLARYHQLAHDLHLSTNQMLTRTILTSGATAISIIPLLIFGGPALFEFTAAILFGIVVGTSSSIFIAAPILLFLGEKRLRREAAPVAAPQARPATRP